MSQGCADVSDMTDSHIKATEPFQKGCCTFSVVALSLFYCPLCRRCVRSDLYCGCEAVRCLLWWDSIRRGHMHTAELPCPFFGALWDFYGEPGRNTCSSFRYFFLLDLMCDFGSVMRAGDFELLHKRLAWCRLVKKKRVYLILVVKQCPVCEDHVFVGWTAHLESGWGSISLPFKNSIGYSPVAIDSIVFCCLVDWMYRILCMLILQSRYIFDMLCSPIADMELRRMAKMKQT